MMWRKEGDRGDRGWHSTAAVHGRSREGWTVILQGIIMYKRCGQWKTDQVSFFKVCCVQDSLEIMINSSSTSERPVFTNGSNGTSHPPITVQDSHPPTAVQDSHPSTVDQGYRQDPIAVVGFANRLPGHSTNPTKLWEFLARGGIAQNEPPESRFRLEGHFDGSRKPYTMRTPGAMFIEDVDIADFDAPFFNVPRVDAIAMDPQQRQLLEVVYEGLENAGITLEQLNGAAYGCFVGSYAVDYMDMAARDPEYRPQGITIGGGRAILSNRISHFLNIKGPSMTIDTACSGTLVSMDVACRYLQTRQVEGVIIAGANLYCSPEHCLDQGAMRGASSATGKCHTFDAKADGYCRSEAINAVILKRLDDAIRDGDPIRAVIRGTSTNSDGWTPGIASPNSDAQAVAIRAAYAAAGITDLNGTGYLECHGTGTPAGDPIEVTAAASVFGPSRSQDNPLIIGSIKSNLGHSEPAAGLSGLLKAILAIEKGIIPGNPTFIDPNPKIDFKALKVRATRTAIPWPDLPTRIASVNSFGYGGSNAHAVLQDVGSFLRTFNSKHVSSLAAKVEDLFADDDEVAEAPQVLVFSANNEPSLKSYSQELKKHLRNPGVSVKLSDLAYTLSEKRSRHFHRAYVVTKKTDFDQGAIVFGKKSADVPKIGFVFTGQGAQWSQMGKGVATFPLAKRLLERLDKALQTLPIPPTWSLLTELVEPRSPEQLRLPEFSQPLVTALQLAIFEIFKGWGINAQSVVGHSSGEIAAACVAGLLTPEDAIKVAFYRGQAAKDLQAESEADVGMMAVGLGPEDVQPYISDSEDYMQIACYNSPNSVTLSGKVSELEKVRTRLVNDSHFARLLQVNLAYHSKFMAKIGEHYQILLQKNCSSGKSIPRGVSIKMFSSVTGKLMDQPADALYWKINMVSPVRFDQACQDMLSGREGADFIVEIGPSGALAGPVGQIKKKLPGQGSNIQYFASLKRGPDSVMSMFDVAGRAFISGGSVDLAKVNQGGETSETDMPSTIVDLPNYVWDRSTKYIYENDASKDWRFRPFVHHDLLGAKILGAPWQAPTFRKIIDLEHQPWLKDHKMSSDIIFPAAGYIAMAVEAIYQTIRSINPSNDITSADQLRYRLRNIKFNKALIMEESNPTKMMLTLTPNPGTKNPWYNFTVISKRDDVTNEHCQGLIRLEDGVFAGASAADLAPLKHSAPASLWYKAMSDAGYGFGPLFQRLQEVEAISGDRCSRSLISLIEPTSTWQQSPYPMHPVIIDACFQSVTPSLVAGKRTAMNAVLVPAIIDDLIIHPRKAQHEIGLSAAYSEYVGRGRPEENKNYMASCSVYDRETGAALLQLKGLRFHKLDTGKDSSTAQTYTCSEFKPDITFFTDEQFNSFASEEPSTTIARVIDLVAHKMPTLKVMEVNLSPGDISSVWFQDDTKASRAAYRQYAFATSDPDTLINVQEQYEARKNTTFDLFDISKPEIQPTDMVYDLLILKMPKLSEEALANVAKHSSKLLSEGGYALFIEQNHLTTDLDFTDDAGLQLTAIMGTNGFSKTLKIPYDTVQSVYLSVIKPKDVDKISVARSISLVTISEVENPISSVKKTLEESGWEVSVHPYPFKDLKPNSTVVIVDELSSPILATITEAQWQAVKDLINREYGILWVTSGSQLIVTNPDNALVHGFFRTIRAENPMLRLTTLDVESVDSPFSISAVDRILEFLQKPAVSKTNRENEFVERGGVINVARILPDEKMNQVKNDESWGAELELKSLHDLVPCARLRAERLGTLDSLHFSEISEGELPVADGCVEVEIYAAGLNFKDVAVTMGIVPENEHLLGLEGAGIIRRIGKGVDSYKPGDRVVTFEKGTFANRIQATTERTHLLPDSMSYEEASTLPSVYLTSVYALLNMAKLRKGQSILIHSAAGGIGFASIQLAQYVGAEIYVTVGTEEKRKYLAENFGIPPERMFSSRTTAFGSEIMKVTQGKGIDVIFNSLTGELLDESWRICADGGIMVEIGKKDIVDRNSLSMEPFDRNCSFMALDFSHKQISDTLIASLLDRVFNLIEQGHLTPIRPIKIFPFEEIPAAFAFMRSGRHLGKIVLSNGEGAVVKVPVRHANRKFALRSDAAYLVVGGLKGLCGTLAVFMAEHGAKHIIAMSRSGSGDEKSQGIIESCNALGCEMQEAKGDVSNLEDVRRAFKQARLPICGIIQGAMVLRDKPYEIMTVDEFHTTISNKVQGTWNLHTAAQEHELTLDFFTMLSSISGVVGQKAQANYAAANVFMDAFATYRHGLGLRANAVDLGVIEDVGYIAARDGMQQQLDTDQWLGINEAVLRKILSYSIFQQTNPINKASSAQLITGIPVPQQEDSILAKDARFGGLFIGESSVNGGKGNNDGSKDIQAFFLRLRSGGDPAAVLAAGLDILNKQFMKTLRLSEPMEPAKSLSSYGLDSLSAVEVRNWVRMDLGVEVTLLEITSAASLISLCEKIIEKISAAAPPTNGSI
ncbi:hypothetical protein B7463_g7334, partial [Scytalidium lignicola]